MANLARYCETIPVSNGNNVVSIRKAGHSTSRHASRTERSESGTCVLVQSTNGARTYSPEESQVSTDLARTENPDHDARTLSIKWINDINLGNKKIGGVLVEKVAVRHPRLYSHPATRAERGKAKAAQASSCEAQMRSRGNSAGPVTMQGFLDCARNDTGSYCVIGIGINLFQTEPVPDTLKDRMGFLVIPSREPNGAKRKWRMRPRAKHEWGTGIQRRGISGDHRTSLELHSEDDILRDTLAAAIIRELTATKPTDEQVLAEYKKYCRLDGLNIDGSLNIIGTDGKPAKKFSNC